jgi:hypothetical protein
MGGKKMEGNEQQKRDAAKEAKDAGKKPSEMGATTGASQQRTEAKGNASHQKKLDLKNEGEHGGQQKAHPEARPVSRDSDTPDRERFPRG